MTTIRSNFDAARLTSKALVGFNATRTTRLIAGLDAARLTSKALVGFDTARMVRQIAAVLDSGRMLREALAGLDTTLLVRDAFPGLDSTVMLREAFKVFEPSQLQQALVTARNLLGADGYDADHLAVATSSASSSTPARAPLLPGLADPWGQIQDMQVKDWLPIWISLVGLILAWMALHPKPCLGPEEIEQVVRTGSGWPDDYVDHGPADHQGPNDHHVPAKDQRPHNHHAPTDYECEEPLDSGCLTIRRS